MRRMTTGFAILLVQVAMAEAGAASILYSTNDLGTSFQTLRDAGMQEYGVAGTNGVAYAFDKSPVTSLDLFSFNPVQNTSYYLSMQAGKYQVGFGVANDPGNSPYGFFPSFMSFSSGWNSDGFDPVSDLNIQGQVVGKGVLFLGTGPTPFLQTGTFAAFSAIGEKSHGGYGPDAFITDNLNNYIASIPGVSLTSSVTIDDLGRIVAYGSDGHCYLLTPEALGPAATVPEPTTALLMGLAISVYAIRSRQRHGGK